MFRKILNHLQEILILLNELRNILLALRSEAGIVEADELLDNCDAKRYLNVSDSTLYRWRKHKLIKSSLIGGKHFYSKSSLKKLLKEERK